MDEDENISMIISMGFSNIDEVKRALRIAKNDVNEAVSILMDQPLTSYGTVDDLSLDFDMKYAGKSDETSGSGNDSQMGAEGCSGNGSTLEFPVSSLYELESRVFQVGPTHSFSRLIAYLITSQSSHSKITDLMAVLWSRYWYFYFRLQHHLSVNKTSPSKLRSFI